jgi:Ca2+-binding RTX toxin-like protein
VFTVGTQAQFSTIPLTVDGGTGNDFLRGSDGNDVLIGGLGDDDVDGGRGADTEILGAGEDTALWVPGEGSDIIDGGRGPDSLVFIGSAGNEAFTLAPDGAAAVLNRDVGGIHMHMNRVEDVELQALGGNDTIAVGDLSRTSLRLADLRLSGSGGADGTADGVLDTVAVQGTDGADHITVGATGSTADITGLSTETRISGADTPDQLHISTGAGDDSVDVGSAAAALLQISTDLGADQH